MASTRFANPLDYLSRSLTAFRTQMSTTSENITNASVRGAMRKDVLLNPLLSGVVAEDQTVFRDTQTAIDLQKVNGQEAYWKTAQSTYQRFLNQFGTKEHMRSLDTMCQSICSEVLKLNGDVSATQKHQVIKTIETQLKKFSDIQDAMTVMRLEIDQDKQRIVNTEIPELMHKLVHLNQRTKTASEVESLNLAQFDLAQKIGPIEFEGGRETERGLFTVKVGPIKLLEKSFIKDMHYTPTPNPQPGVPLGAVTETQSNTNMEPYIESGELGGLIRADQHIMSVQSALDTFSQHLKTTLNQIHNLGTGTQAPPMLQGEVGHFGAEGMPLTGGEIVSGIGTLRIALLDTSQNNTLTDYVDVSLLGNETVNNLMQRINAAAYQKGSGQTFTMSINAQGAPVLSVNAANTNPNLGVSVGSVGGAPAMLSLGGVYDAATATNFSHFFHLNDLITSSAPSGAPGLFGTMRVRQDLSVHMNRLSGCALDDSPVPGDYGVIARPPEVRDVFAKMHASFQSNQNFAASGEMAAVTTTISNYGASIMTQCIHQENAASTAVKASTAELQDLQRMFNEESGIDPEQEKLKSFQIAKSQRAVMSMLQQLMRLDEEALGLLKV